MALTFDRTVRSLENNMVAKLSNYVSGLDDRLSTVPVG
jgi:hypothetical protein